MKIAVITLPLHTNYGGILQAYALQTLLEKGGHEVDVLNREKRKDLPFRKKPLKYLQRAIRKYLLGKKDIVIREEYRRVLEYRQISQFTQPFIDKYIHSVYTPVKRLRPGIYDAIVVGSDQIWRPRYYRRIENAYLDFARTWKIRRVAYAPSFGTGSWDYSPEQTEKCAALLKLFDAVSVREKDGATMCREHFGIDAVHVLDPTLLLPAEEYIRLFRNAGTPRSKGSLMVYILDRTECKDGVVRKIAAERSLVPFAANALAEDPEADLKDRIQPPVESWLRGFYDAEYIVTDSFHACIFSIIFRKPFIVCGNRDRGMSRFESLLEMFGISDRLVADYAGFAVPEDIDYDKVYCRLKEMQDFSVRFLEKALPQ